MSHSFTFNGISSTDLKLVIQSLPPRAVPTQRVTTYTVPGRDGSLHMNDGCYDSIVMAIDCVVTDQSKISDICVAYQGAGTLTHSGMPGFLYKATVLNATDIARMSSRWGIFQLRFECQPFRYFDNNPIILMDTPGGGELVTHLGNVEAQPLLKVFGTGTLSFVVSGYRNPSGSEVDTATFTIHNVNAYVCIDSETMTVYKTSTNKLADFTSSDGRFPRLSPYGNTLSWPTPGPITKIEVTPNWRSL